VQQLQRLRPEMQSSSLPEGVHEGMYAGDEEVEAQGPEGEVGEEAE
jgi:hypothetical protein